MQGSWDIAALSALGSLPDFLEICGTALNEAKENGGIVLSIKFRVLSAFFTALCMSMCMAFIMAFINVGASQALVFAWLKGWGIGLCVTFPLSYFLPPWIQKALRRLGFK